MSSYNVGILGATGAVGQQMLGVPSGARFPRRWFEAFRECAQCWQND